jgi:hypothetical protein
MPIRQTGRPVGGKTEQLRPRKLLADDHLPVVVEPHEMKNGFAQIDANGV